MKFFLPTFFVVTSILLTSGCFAQPRLRPDQGQSTPFMLEATSLPSPHPGTTRLDVGYRIASSFFVFVKANSSEGYSARAELLVEILDTNLRSVARNFLSESIPANHPPVEGSRESYYSGAISFEVPPGKYSISFEISDLESSRKFRDENKKVTVGEFRDSILTYSDAIMTKGKYDVETGSFAPFALSGDVSFGHTAGCFVQFSQSRSQTSSALVYRIFQKRLDQAEPVLVVSDTISEGSIHPANVLAILQTNDRYSYQNTTMALPGISSVWFPLNIDTLDQGTYTLELKPTSGDTSKKLKQEFRIRWVDMPLPLRSLQSAINAMEYVLSEDEFRNLRRASAVPQRVFFDAFWKKRDLTAGTAYNEVLNEYYLRVEFAMKTYGTLSIDDGSKTERGKAHILYGPPTRIERILLPSSDPQETWYYTSIAKKLVFVDRSRHGDYRLISMGQL